jgi:hypothetical protein
LNWDDEGYFDLRGQGTYYGKFVGLSLRDYFVYLISVFTPQDSVNWEDGSVEVYQWYCQPVTSACWLMPWQPFTLYRTLATQHKFIENSHTEIKFDQF